MKKTNPTPNRKRLVVSAQTLKQLSTVVLQDVAGGYPYTGDPCFDSIPPVCYSVKAEDGGA